MNNQLLKVIWIPLLGIWGLLFAIYFDTFKNSSGLVGFPVLIACYIATSSFLSYKLRADFQLAGEEDSVTTVSKGYSAISCLVIATVITVIGTIAYQSSNPWVCLSVISCAVVFLFYDGLSSYSQEQITLGNTQRVVERNNALASRVKFKNFLNTLLQSHPSPDRSIELEVSRILSIIEYSSYFRCHDIDALCDRINSADGTTQIVSILKEVK